MPAPLFKRWAPPKPVAKQSSPIATSSAQTISSEKRSLSPEAQRHVPSHVPQVSEPSIETTKSIKKPKKRKKDAEAKSLDEGDEQNLKKHKNVLSKFGNVSKLAQIRSQNPEEEHNSQEEEKVAEELHDLDPIPQPAPVPEPVFEPTFSALPTWLAQPIIVQSSNVLPFSKLGVNLTYVKKLEKQGFTDALAVQTALLPMLHPGFEQHLGDICVSAKTGSGKTLAYLLPIVEALKDRAVPVLSAIIVVPSRQLVNQALQVAEALCAGTKTRIGTALGSMSFAAEQKLLVKTRAQYDPKRARELHERTLRQSQTGWAEHRGFTEDLKSMPLDHIPCYDSCVDILICTPGRLVEHIENTTGFLLNNVRWLVIDEADQLLNQDFQGWTSVLMNALHSETPSDLMDAQERIRKRECDASSIWSTAFPNARQITKVVLSATMDKDITKLSTLELKRPKLVIIQDEVANQQSLEHEESIFELPLTLDEFAVHVADGSNKPLHLLYILQNHVFPGLESASDDGSSSSSDTDSDTSSQDSPDEERLESVTKQANCALVFTKSTESASRLSHLLSILEPSLAKNLKTMTRALTSEASRKLLKAFSTGEIKILVASDTVSRGLDIPSITHVINYDMPTSITNYVHRVGRTARAGKTGQAWTLFTKAEAAWFLNQVTKGESITRRDKKVKRIELKESVVTANGRKKAYQIALKQLESAVTDHAGDG